MPEYQNLKIYDDESRDEIVLGLVLNGYTVKVEFIDHGTLHEDNHYKISYK